MTPRQTPTDWMRLRMRGVLEPIAGLAARLGLTPNMITVFGFLINIATAILVAQGRFTAGGLVLLIFGPLDAVDGTLARLTGQKSRFGAFLDSTLDRYSDAALYFGFLVYFLGHSDSPAEAPLLVFAALVGSLLVSYTRARAEALGIDCKVGLMTRMERWFVLTAGLILGLVIPALWVIAVLANVTALYRMVHVWRQTAVASD